MLTFLLDAILTVNIISRCPQTNSFIALASSKTCFVSVSRERDSHLLVHGAAGLEAFLPGCGAGHGHLCFHLYRYEVCSKLFRNVWINPEPYKIEGNII